MKNTFKFTAAAIMIIATTLSSIFFDATVPSAYALEQTIKAFHSIKSIHARIYYPINSEPALVWAEFDDTGQTHRLRFSQPAFDPHDGPKEAVWENDTAQVWSRKTNTLYLIHNAEASEITDQLFRDLDPKRLLQRLEDMEQAGTAHIEIEQPERIDEPIIVIATLQHEDPYLGWQVTAYIDQATKLATSLETVKGDGTLDHKNGHFGPEDFHLIEFYDYNQPFDDNIFVLNVPEDVLVIDRVSNQVGLSQNEMSIEETATKVVKHFFKALLDEDYHTAGLMYGGIPAEKLKQAFERQTEGQILKIISIGTVKKHPNPDYQNKAFLVPCILELIKDGQTQSKTYNCVVREVDGQPGQWAICGGI